MLPPRRLWSSCRRPQKNVVIVPTTTNHATTRCTPLLGACTFGVDSRRMQDHGWLVAGPRRGRLTHHRPAMPNKGARSVRCALLYHAGHGYQRDRTRTSDQRPHRHRPHGTPAPSAQRGARPGLTAGWARGLRNGSANAVQNRMSSLWQRRQKNVVVAPTMTNESFAGPTWSGRIGVLMLGALAYCSRKPPRKRRNRPPSRGSAGAAGGAVARSVAIGRS
jgi:hypothetical protein